MRTLTFNIDYTYCPEGHKWVFVPDSIVYPDCFWCKDCDCFYRPTVKRVKRGTINKNYSSDRESDIIRRAEFLKWKATLKYSDMPD